jgi:hypothetical protein
MATAKQKRQQHSKTRVAAASPLAPVNASPQVRLISAHAKFTETHKGTPEHDRAWEELVDALFDTAK